MGNIVQPLRSSFTNADIVACVLTSLPDFHCLASAILISKTVYNVFQQHPHSIVRAVAYNLVGPALPQALRFVRCQNARLHSRPVDELLDDDDIQKNPVLSNRDIRSLVAVSTTVQELENLFSLRMKDRRFRTSQLSLAESTRLRKAIYRLSLFSDVYGITAQESAHVAESDEEIELEVEEAQQLRRGFFNCFATPELREIQRVDFFLRGMLAGATGHSPDSRTIVDWAVYSIYCNSSNVLDLYNGTTTLPMDEWDEAVDQRFWIGFMEKPLFTVLDDRKEPHLLPSDRKQPILDEVIGEHDLCSQCQSGKGLELWGPSNWSYLRANSLFCGMTHLLKGYLSFNQPDILHFKTIVKQTSPEQLIGGLFKYKTSAYGTWNKEDWLCEECLEKFIREHLHIWYVGQKVKRGHTIAENCWYGYNCRTQTHKPAHARKLNHWCAPIMGDAPPKEEDEDVM